MLKVKTFSVSCSFQLMLFGSQSWACSGKIRFFMFPRSPFTATVRSGLVSGMSSEGSTGCLVTPQPSDLATGPLSLMGFISASSVSANQPWRPNPWPDFQGHCLDNHSSTDKAGCHQHTGDIQAQSSAPAG